MADTLHLEMVKLNKLNKKENNKMNLNEAIETLNRIVKENPDKKTGLYTACDVVANHICNIVLYR